MRFFGLDIKRASDISRNKLVSNLLWSWAYGSNLQPEDNFEAFMKAYRGWVYVAANKNAVSAASIPLRLYVGKTDSKPIKSHPTKKISREQTALIKNSSSLSNLPQVRKAIEIEEVTDHPILTLMRNVNSFMNYFSLFELTNLYQELCGNAYWYLIEDKLGVPREIWPIPPQNVRIVPDKIKFIKEYKFVRGFDEEIFSEESVIHFKFPSPTSMYYGKAPLAAVTDSYNISQNINRYENFVFGNMGRIEGAFETDNELSQYEFDRLKEEIAQTFRGVENVGKSPLLEKGVKYKPYGLAPKDLSFMQGRKAVKEEICFLPDTKIFTLSGVKDIKDVCVGDIVMTHKGNLKPVIKRFENDYNGKVISLQASGLDRICVTPDHPFFCCENGNGLPVKKGNEGRTVIKKADDLLNRERIPHRPHRYMADPFDFLLMPKLKMRSELNSLDLSTFCVGMDNLIIEDAYIKIDNGNAKPVNRFVELDYQFGRLVGLYIAEGCIGDNRQILMYFHKDEHAYQKESKDSIEKYFGISASINDKLDCTVRYIRATSKPAAAFFEQFGPRSTEKILPQWVFSANKKFIDGLISGLVDGDGACDDDSAGLCSSSINLIWQIRVILSSIGVYSRLYGKRNVGFLTDKPPNMIYYLSWAWKHSGKKYITGENNIKHFMKSKEYSDYNGKVYNLEVKDDNSYFTTGGVVHNCNAYGQSLGLYDKDATRANAEVASFTHMKDTIKPRLTRMEEKLNEKLTPKFDDKLFVAFDNPVPENKEFRLKELESHLKTGYSSINMEREVDNKDKVDWGDLPIINSNMIPLGSNAEPANPTDEPESEPISQILSIGIDKVSEVLAGAISNRIKNN